MTTDRTTLVLTHRDICQIVSLVGSDNIMDLMISRLETAFASSRTDSSNTPTRAGFITGHTGNGVLEWMPHHETGRAVTIKTVSYAPDNPSRCGLPTILGTVARLDDRTGRLVALADAALSTALRTGAASAVATRLLAQPGSTVVGLVGAGAQAVTQLHAVSRVLPVREALVFDVREENSRSFRERVAFLGIDVRVAELAEVEARSDVICTATSVRVGAGPVLTGERLKPTVHINAVGSDLPGKVEIPLAVLKSAFVCPDHTEQAMRDGECQRLSAGDFPHSLPELCASPGLARRFRNGWTVFDSTGFALEDHVALDVFSELADQHRIGMNVPLEAPAQDVFNPYSGLTDEPRRQAGAMAEEPALHG